MRDGFTIFLMIILIIFYVAIAMIALLVDIYLVLDEEIFSVSYSTGLYISI